MKGGEIMSCRWIAILCLLLAFAVVTGCAPDVTLDNTTAPTTAMPTTTATPTTAPVTVEFPLKEEVTLILATPIRNMVVNLQKNLESKDNYLDQIIPELPIAVTQDEFINRRIVGEGT